MTPRELEVLIDSLTDEPPTGAALHRVTALVTDYGAGRIADLIDGSCYYVKFGPGFAGIQVALAQGSRCPMEDWHEVARRLRAGPGG